MTKRGQLRGEMYIFPQLLGKKYGYFFPDQLTTDKTAKKLVLNMAKRLKKVVGGGKYINESLTKLENLREVRALNKTISSRTSATRGSRLPRAFPGSLI